jgi:GTP-binding protein
VAISAATGQGVRELMFRVADALDAAERDLAEQEAKQREIIGLDSDLSELLDTADPEAAETAIHNAQGERVYRFTNPYRWEAFRDGQGFGVRGKSIERLAAMTDFRQEEAVYRFQQIMAKLGIDKKLRKIGVQEGDIVRIGKVELEWSEDEFV